MSLLPLRCWCSWVLSWAPLSVFLCDSHPGSLMPFHSSGYRLQATAPQPWLSPRVSDLLTHQPHQGASLPERTQVTPSRHGHPDLLPPSSHSCSSSRLISPIQAPAPAVLSEPGTCGSPISPEHGVHILSVSHLGLSTCYQLSPILVSLSFHCL